MNFNDNPIKWAIAEYGYPFLFAVITITAIFNIFVLVRIKFGTMSMTKLTLIPYWRSLAFLVWMLFECIYYLVMTEIVFSRDEYFEKFFDSLTL